MTIVPHLRCNQACTFCHERRTQDDRAFIQEGAVQRRIEAALERGAEELILGGGEPTLRGDLPRLVRHARSHGARRVVLETNAILLESSRVQALREAGLSLARVHLSGWGEHVDGWTRDEGGFAATVRGIEALLAAGVDTEIAAVVVRSTAQRLPELPGALVGRWGQRLHGLSLSVPSRSPAPDELLSPSEAATTIGEVEQAARRVGLWLRLTPQAPPPCVFPPHQRPAHLYAMTPGGAHEPGRRKLATCSGCRMVDRCAGFAEETLERFGPPPHWPITEERVRRRLSMVGDVRAQVARELVTPTLQRREGGLLEETIRINFHCNQACSFCFVSTHLPPPPVDTVREAIVEAAARGARLVLSGGEPTLNPRLPEYLALARGLSPHAVQLQTNAVRLDDAELCARLVEAGLTEAFVSLHGASEATSDAVTQAPGTFRRTLKGIDHLVAAGVTVVLNYVLCSLNLEELVPFVDLVAARWPQAQVNVSFVAPSSDLVPADEAHIPRYSRAAPLLLEAMSRARQRQLAVVGLDSMCGVPLCFLPDEVALALAPNEIPAGFDGGEFVRAEACQGCALERRCFGLRRRYAQLYGTDELRRIAQEADVRAAT